MTAASSSANDDALAGTSRTIDALIFDFGNVLQRFDNAILWREVAALTTVADCEGRLTELGVLPAG